MRSHFSQAHSSVPGNISGNVKGRGREYSFFIKGQSKKQMKKSGYQNKGARRCVREEKTVPPNDPGCGLEPIDLESDEEVLTDAGYREGDIVGNLDVPGADRRNLD